MKIIKTNKDESILVDDNFYDYLNKFKWTKDGRGYAITNGDYKIAWKKLKMHQMVLKPKKGFIIDHINGNRLDNRLENLRYATYSQNKMNQNVTSRNQVGYKGVSPSRPGKYIAQITAEGKRVHLGTFTDPKEAAKAYNEAAKRIHGEFANLNIIEEELS